MSYWPDGDDISHQSETPRPKFGKRVIHRYYRLDRIRLLHTQISLQDYLELVPPLKMFRYRRWVIEYKLRIAYHADALLDQKRVAQSNAVRRAFLAKVSPKGLR